MKTNTIFSLFVFLAVCATGLFAQETVEKVHVIFKTHLDIGYTDLASNVEQRYITEFIPKAIAVGNQLRAEGSKDRYVWTTGSWLISAYLQQATPEAVKELEDAIQRGDIVWNGVPYTVESEAMSQELFETILRLSQRLDKRFGKKTIAAKFTDVPGHTRGIISPLYDAGIHFLDVGCNNQSAVPQVPPICVWRNTDGKEITLMYHGEYGDDCLLPDGKTVIAVKFTGDNHGPHTLEQVKSIYAGLRKKYPKAEVVASTFNDVAEIVSTMNSQLPVVTSEIGDTWIYGYASQAVMMSQYRALLRLYTDWIKTGKIDPKSDIAVDYAVRLGMVAEHTWGLAGSKLKNYDKTDVDVFNASRHLPAFRLMEESWQEKAKNVNKAIALLPENLQAEANTAIKNIGNVAPIKMPEENAISVTNGAFHTSGIKTEITYQTFSVDDYLSFYKSYVRGKYAREGNTEFGNPELRNTQAQTASITAKVVSNSDFYEGAGTNPTSDSIFSFPDHPAIDKKVLPEQVHTQYVINIKKHDGKDRVTTDLTVSLVNKPANRLPEAYWVSFVPENIKSIIVEKMGWRVNVLDVVEGGNRQMHGIDNYVDIATDKGTFRITSLDAPLVAIGERSALNYSTSQPDITKGIHFCLYDNLWGTNFALWWEGSLEYRFKIELIK